MMNKNRQLF